METQDDGFNDIFGPIPENIPSPEAKSFADEIAGYATPKEPTLTDSLKGRFQNVKNIVSDTGKNMDAIVNDSNSGLINDAQGIALTGTEVGRVPLRVTGQVGGAIGDVVGAGVKEGVKNLNMLATGDPTIDAVKGIATKFKDTVAPHLAEPMAKAASKWEEFKLNNPELAKDMGDIGNMFNIAGLGEAVPIAKNVIKESVSAVPEVVSSFSKGGKNLSKVENATIDAINPDLSGKKLSSAYSEVVKGDRTIKPSGIFTEQSLSPSERAITVGKRLANPTELSDGTIIDGISLNSNHVKNLPKLKTALTNTESKLNTLLEANPNINAAKPTLFKSLNEASKTAPEEFRIGDATKMYDSVFKFANKVANESDDTIKGLRKARSAFDNQARTQYPSAFKDGAIDTKSPAGAAIKRARDIFNEHLYNTAPNGSDIQKLIGREADILQATEPISAKAAAGEGMTKVQKVTKAIKEHPVASVIGAGATGYGVAKTLGQ